MRNTNASRLSLWTLGLLPFLCLSAGVAPAADFTVAPDGSDTNPGTPAQPFATVTRARDAVRQRIAAGLTTDVTVLLRGGTYEMGEPLVFTPQDSAPPGHAITYAAYPGEKPLLSGGRRINGWTQQGKLWTTTVPAVKAGDWYFRQLFVNGHRAQRARTPNAGFFHVQGEISLDKPSHFGFALGDIKPEWAGGDVEVVALQAWAEIRMPIRNVTANTPVYRPGKIGTALTFDGITQYVSVPHSPSLEPQSLTLAAWVNFADFPGGADPRRWIVSKNGNEWENGHYGLIVSAGRAGAYLNIGGGQDNAFMVMSPAQIETPAGREAARPLAPNQWHHLAMTYDGAVLRLFVDGQPSGIKAINKPRAPGTGPLNIGRRPDAYNFTKAALDEVRLYDRTLGDEEIKALAAGAGPDAGLAARWSLDEVPGAAIHDLSGNGHDGTFMGPATVTLAGAASPYNREGNARYWIENAPDALDAPGEWYLDRKSGVLSYWPLPDEDMTKAEIIAPRLTELVRFRGDVAGGKFVSDIHLTGLNFAFADWSLAATGYADLQAANDIPGVIEANGAVGCAIEKCAIQHAGNYGIEWGQGCKNNRVIGCEISDLGAGGVKIGEGEVRAAPAEQTSANTVSDCHIHDLGFVYPAAIGVWIGQSSDNTVAHNHIHDTNYTAISLGWTWGYGPTNAKGNIIEFNHIHDVGRGMLSDMGGIYSLGVQPGTIIRHNVLHDISSYGYGGWGIYTDEGSSGILVENNIVYRTKSNPFNQHYGKGNIVRNNIFALGGEGVISHGRADPPTGQFRLEHNILLANGQPIYQGGYASDLRNSPFNADSNLLWDKSGKLTLAAQDGLRSLDQWRALGQDKNSLIADPLFIDPDKGDFRLQPNSPAAKIGFQPIDASQVGPRPGF